ncbi:hypothetical protein Hdeb2414_s0019g00544411 [Helianthus debilis subsp. tardiflorus]
MSCDFVMKIGIAGVSFSYGALSWVRVLFFLGVLDMGLGFLVKSRILGLLSLCLDMGLGFLVKSRVSMIMGLSNLFVLEGNVDALRSLAEAGPRSLSSEGSLPFTKRSIFGLYVYCCFNILIVVEVVQAVVCQYPNLGVAAKFQKTRTLYVSYCNIGV